MNASTKKLAAIEYLGGQCQDCGSKFKGRMEVFDFDHRYGKKIGVGAMLPKYSWAAIVIELDKCDLVCSNCHRTRTAERLRYGVAMCE